MLISWGKGDVILRDGVQVASADRSWFRGRAEVTIGPETWRYSTRGWGRGTVVAEVDGSPRWSARRSGVFTARWTFDVDEELVLAQVGWLGSRLALTRGGTEIGSCSRTGLFNGRPQLELGEELDLRVVCFVLWVAFVELNRGSSDGGGAAGAAT